MTSSITALRTTLAGEIDNPQSELQVEPFDRDSPRIDAELTTGLDEDGLDEIMTALTSIRFPFLADSTNGRLQAALRS